MMDQPLLVSGLLEHAAKIHGTAKIVLRTTEGPILRYGYPDAHARIGQLAHALGRLGVAVGDRIATLGWNNYRHLPHAEPAPVPGPARLYR
jgi:acyl-CoA synthetase (AMP-forming)/AMP-acid ligase II